MCWVMMVVKVSTVVLLVLTQCHCALPFTHSTDYRETVHVCTNILCPIRQHGCESASTVPQIFSKSVLFHSLRQDGGRILAALFFSEYCMMATGCLFQHVVYIISRTTMHLDLKVHSNPTIFFFIKKHKLVKLRQAQCV